MRQAGWTFGWATPHRSARLAIAGVLLFVFSLPAIAGDEKYDPKMIKCTMRYNLKGWSFFYSEQKGEGKISCSNGASADVAIKSYGGGLTAGKSEIIGAKGVFSQVREIDELFGGYAKAEAHVGVGESVHATIVTKGEISLALSGKGKGVDLGISVGSFVISKK